MTKVIVDAGICGFTAMVEVARLSWGNATVAIDCEMVSKLVCNNRTRLVGYLESAGRLFGLQICFVVHCPEM